MLKNSLSLLLLFALTAISEPHVTSSPSAPAPSPWATLQAPPRIVYRPLATPLYGPVLAANPAELTPLQQDWIAFFPLADTLTGWLPQGRQTELLFMRNSRAFSDALAKYAAHVPRYVACDGRTGLRIEYAHMDTGRNLLHPAIAQVERIEGIYRPVAGASLARSEQGPAGWPALDVTAPAPSSGFQTVAEKTRVSHRVAASGFFRGTPGVRARFEVIREDRDGPPPTPDLALKTETELNLSLELDDLLALAIKEEEAPAPVDHPALAAHAFTFSGDWQRVAFDFQPSDVPVASHAHLPGTQHLALRVVSEAPASFQAANLMLESLRGYAGFRSASSWMPGYASRDADLLLLPDGLLATDQGTVAFSAWLVGDVAWRRLFAIGPGWQPALMLDLRNNRQVQLAEGGAITINVALPTTLHEGPWHDFVISWTPDTWTLFLNGDALGSAPRKQPLPATYRQVALGGEPANWSPGLRDNGIYTDLALWKRALTAEDVATWRTALASDSPPMAIPALAIHDLEPISVFPRDYLNRLWPLEIANHGHPGKPFTLQYGIRNVFGRSVPLDQLAQGTAAELALPWSPALLEPGEYRFVMSILSADGNTLATATRDIEIVPPRIAYENVQVWNWEGIEPSLARLGVTSAGLQGRAGGGPDPRGVEQAARQGLYTQARINLWGEGVGEEDYFMNAGGEPQTHLPDQRRPHPLADAIVKTDFLRAQLERLPDVRQLILNTEKNWVWGIDFRASTQQYVRERFGFDMTPWVEHGPVAWNQSVLPFGRLALQYRDTVFHTRPADGIIAPDEPFYQYHRWWHSAEVGNEVFLGNLMAERLNDLPHLETIVEPALRRPPVRAYDGPTILQEWFYYSDPLSAITIQERLAAAARGTDAAITGMPQFLFKPGMAAPYGGLPTPDLYRRAVWHCLARPMRALSYWNLWTVLRKQGEHQVTQETIDERLGQTPTWEEAAAKSDVRGDWSNPFLVIPELEQALADMHWQVVHPLGALWPNWRNRPRQLAVYQSLGSFLYYRHAWARNRLGPVINRVPYGYDILFDQDFEDTPGLLDAYRVLVVAEGEALPEQALATIRRFVERGGRVVVDAAFPDGIEGIQRFDWDGIDMDRDARGLEALEQRLLAQYGSPDNPQFIEEMETAAAETGLAAAPSQRALAAILDGLQPEARLVTQAPGVYINSLMHGAANYLVVVNSLGKPGPHYGHFERRGNTVIEDGVAQTVDLEVAPQLGAVVYDLLAAEAVPVTEHDDAKRFTLHLPAAGGRVLALLPAAVAGIDVVGDPRVAAVRGSFLTLEARLLDVAGQPVPGLIPAALRIVDEQDRPVRDPAFGAFVDGAWSTHLPIPHNTTSQSYHITLEERATGDKATWRIDIPAKQTTMQP